MRTDTIVNVTVDRTTTGFRADDQAFPNRRQLLQHLERLAAAAQVVVRDASSGKNYRLRQDGLACIYEIEQRGWFSSSYQPTTKRALLARPAHRQRSHWTLLLSLLGAMGSTGMWVRGAQMGASAALWTSVHAQNTTATPSTATIPASTSGTLPETTGTTIGLTGGTTVFSTATSPAPTPSFPPPPEGPLVDFTIEGVNCATSTPNAAVVGDVMAIVWHGLCGTGYSTAMVQLTSLVDFHTIAGPRPISDLVYSTYWPVVVPSNSAFTLAWEATGDSLGTGVWKRRLELNGSFGSSEERIDSGWPYLSEYDDYPGLASTVLDNGHGLIAWTTSPDANYVNPATGLQELDSDGGLVGENRLFERNPNVPCAVQQPFFGRRPSGRFLGWHATQREKYCKVAGHLVNSTGAIASAVSEFSPWEARYADVGPVGDEFLSVWEHVVREGAHGSRPDSIQAWRYTDAGLLTGNIVYNLTSGLDRQPVFASKDGIPVLLWSGSEDTNWGEAIFEQPLGERGLPSGPISRVMPYVPSHGDEPLGWIDGLASRPPEWRRLFTAGEYGSGYYVVRQAVRPSGDMVLEGRVVQGESMPTIHTTSTANPSGHEQSGVGDSTFEQGLSAEGGAERAVAAVAAIAATRLAIG